MHFLRIQLVLLVVSCLTFAARAQDDLDVIHGKNQWLQYTDAKNALYQHFSKEAFDHLQKRKQYVAQTQTQEQWKQRQEWIKRSLHEVVGTFPARTPLNARVVRTITMDGYRVEHVLFESRPGFYVTSSLYVPGTLRKKEKAPAIIYCSGHATEGYRSDVYQHVILNLVKKGFIVFAFDPVGQGERLEYFDPATNKSRAGGPTSEHSYPGSQAFITGSSQANYMIWDGIRAVDYLLTRKEVDASRIGITGRSGGGTQSAYIAAFDDRIHAVAPENYITNFTRLLESIGPQDAEQNFARAISEGLDHGDLLIVRAPKPALMITTTRDMFSIQGARETADEVSRVYESFGSQSAFGMVEDDAPHASTKKNREAMYAFFREHLKNPGQTTDEQIALLTKDQLQVTEKGQVSTSLGGETVYSLNLRSMEALLQKKSAPDHTAIADEARKLSGFREPSDVSKRVFTGRIQRDGYTIEKYFVAGEGDYVIPYLVFTPSIVPRKVVLYLHPAGKSSEAAPGGEIEWFVRNGMSVVAPDLPGVGEMSQGDFRGDAFIGGVSHNVWYSSLLIGRSIAGLHAGDIIRVLKSLEPGSQTEVYGVARKEMASALLHAAAFYEGIQGIALVDPLASYRSFVSGRYYHSPFIMGAVAGSLPAYDLPELAASLAPRGLLVVNPRNGSDEEINERQVQEEYGIVRNAYEEKSAEKKFFIRRDVPRQKLRDTFAEWMQ